MHRRGLSDIVTTVLVILLVVAAVVVIWNFVRPTIDQAGSATQGGVACLTHHLDAVSCTTFVGGMVNYTIVGMQLAMEDQSAVDKNVTYSFTYTDGILESFHQASDVPPSSGTVVSNSFSGFIKPLRSVTPTASFRLASGQRVLCPGRTVTCEVSTNTTVIDVAQLAGSASSVGRSIGGGGNSRGHISPPVIPFNINIDFVDYSGGSPTTAKYGSAATGQARDVWNAVAYWPLSSNLKFTNGSMSTVVLRFSDQLGGHWGMLSGLGDSMYDDYIYGDLSPHYTLFLEGVSTGTYDLYVYGHGDTAGQNGNYSLIVGTRSYGTKQTSATQLAIDDSMWTENKQYVRFSDVSVTQGDLITLALHPTSTNSDVVINGLQLVTPGYPSPSIHGTCERNETAIALRPGGDACGGASQAFCTLYQSDGMHLGCQWTANDPDYGTRCEPDGVIDCHNYDSDFSACNQRSLCEWHPA